MRSWTWRNGAAALTAGLLALVAGAAGTAQSGAATPSGGARAPSGGEGHDGGTAPRRVLIVVMDQLRPDFVKAFDMPTVRRLMRSGENFPRAYLGHMASETVVSHRVMTTGVFPKRMGWQDEVYRDTDNVLGVRPDSLWVTGSLTADQFALLEQHSGVRNLADYLHAAHPGTKFAVVGEKPYAVQTAAGPNADITVTFSGRMPAADCPQLGGAWRGPEGVNVPSYIAEPRCGRFYVNSDKANDYGTTTTAPAWMYPEDGNRFVPGHDPAHLGGDTWAADAAIEIMRHENWSGLLVTLGAIDKAAHMWGGITDRPPFPGSTPPEVHLPAIAQNADRQLAKLLLALADNGQLEDTLVVLTADHGSQPSRHFYGVNAAGRGDYNWYAGTAENGTYDQPSPSLQPLLATGNVAFTYQDSAIRTWLTDRSDAKLREAARAMAGLPGVVAVFRKEGDRYRLDRFARPSTRMGRSERRWYKAHAQEIVNTMAAPSAADVVGLLAKDTSYGVAGDHGGAQRNVQWIPLVFWESGFAGHQRRTPARSVDITPTILRELGLTVPAGLDGRAIRLP